MTAAAGGFALVLIEAASNDGYAGLLLVILSVLYPAAVLLIYVLDKSFRATRERVSG